MTLNFNFVKISFLLTSLASPAVNLSAQGLDFYGQTEIFLINYYSSPSNFQEAQKSEPNPIILAVDRSYDRLVRVLINLGTNVNLRDKDGISPLLWAVRKNDNKITQILLSFQASPNNPDNKGWTPLMLAAQNNNLFITRLLIEAGADLNATNFEGSSALLWASRNSSLPLFEYLYREGAELEHRNAKNQNAAHIATQYGQEEILRFILSKDSSLALTKDKERKTPLLKAVENGRYKMVDILAPYEFKGNPDSPLTEAISLAKMQGNIEMETYLRNFFNKSQKVKKVTEKVINTPKPAPSSSDEEEFKSLSMLPEDVRKRILTFLGILDASTVRSIKVKKRPNATGDLWSGTISYSENNQMHSQIFDLKIRKP